MSGALLYFLPVLSFFICFVVGKVQQRGMESYVPISLFVFKYFIYLFESLQRERENIFHLLIHSPIGHNSWG